MFSNPITCPTQHGEVDRAQDDWKLFVERTAVPSATANAKFI